MDGKVRDGKGEGADDQADKGVEDGIFGFLDFGGVASGSHILNTADYYKYYGH